MSNRFSRLRSLREARGLRQLDLVISTGLSPATIWLAEHGDSICKNTRKKIARVLGVKLEEIWPQDQPGSTSTATGPSLPDTPAFSKSAKEK